jgi:hypothetical protein
LKYILQTGRDIEPRHVEEELRKGGRAQAREVNMTMAEKDRILDDREQRKGS